MTKQIVAVFSLPNEERFNKSLLEKFIEFINESTVPNHEVDAKLVIEKVHRDGRNPQEDLQVMITVREWK